MMTRSTRSWMLPALLSCLGAAGALGAAGCTSTTGPEVVAPVEAVPPAASAEEKPPPLPSDLADLVDRVSPSVVNISTLHTHKGSGHPFEMLVPELRRPQPREGAGTGFIIDGAGHVVTNAHVIQGAEEVHVHFMDEREFSARVIGRDRKLDLALLKIDGPEDLPSVRLGDSSMLRVGESVVAVGNPFGLGHTVTMGIVSAKARTIGASAYDDFIQTDASINPGNSGGPLFNLRGEVVAINTAIRAGADGIGFAIPINTLKDVLDQLKQKGFVERGKLGLVFQPITAEMAKALGLDRPRGAMVSDVLPGSSAGRAGILAGDVILTIHGTPVNRAEDLPRTVARHSPGSSIGIELSRNGKLMTVSAVLDKLEGDEPPLPPPPAAPSKPTGKVMLGIELGKFDDGVRVIGFAKPVKGLRVGDLVVEVNGERVTTVADVPPALEKTRPRGSALFKVQRGKLHRYVGVPLDD